MGDDIIIYALCDPDSGKVRYIGKTKNLYNRHHQHLRGKGYFSIKVLQTVPLSDWRRAEREQIAAHIKQGYKLLNKQHMKAIESEIHLAKLKAEGEEWLKEILAEMQTLSGEKYGPEK